MNDNQLNNSGVPNEPVDPNPKAPLEKDVQQKLDGKPKQDPKVDDRVRQIMRAIGAGFGNPPLRKMDDIPGSDKHRA